jgi:hypothetical protein
MQEPDQQASRGGMIASRGLDGELPAAQSHFCAHCDDRRCEHAPQRAWRRHRGPDHEVERDERRYGLQA